MARSTSTQRGASRRTTRTASRGPKSSGASASRSRKPSAASRSRAAASRARVPAGPWVPVAIVLLLAVLAWSLYPALRIQYLASRRLAGVEQQYDSLKKRGEAARQEVDALNTPQGVEKAAREDLGYAKSGEDVYIVVPDGKTANGETGSGVTTASVAELPAPSLLQQFLDLIFGVEQPKTTVEP